MRRSNFALRVPPTLLAEARKAAESEGVALRRRSKGVQNVPPTVNRFSNVRYQRFAVPPSKSEIPYLILALNMV